jgi:diguanylate cyclase (GGDEF)-like protein/PAS domain S-box-containing protein
MDFRELFNHMRSGVAVYEALNSGEDFIFLDLNRAGERIDKIGREVLIGKSVLELFPGVRNFGLFEVFQRVYKTGLAEHHPATFYQDDRLAGWRENYVYKLPSGEVVAIYDDITERIQAEAALKESEERYRAVVELSNDGIALVQKEHHIYANPKLVAIFGYDRPEDIIGQPISLLVHPDDCRRVSDINTRRQRGEPAPRRYEFKGIKKSGEPVYIEISASKVTYQGEPVSLVFMRDVTQRKQIEGRLKKAGEEWQQTFDSMSDGVSLHDTDGTVVRANRALSFVLNKHHSEVVGRKCYQLFHKTSAPIEDCPMVRSAYSRAVEYHEIFEPALNSWISITCSPLVDEENRIRKVVHVVRDITDRKREEEELRALSLMDDLTGLHNRRGFMTLAEHALKTAHRVNRSVWLLFADLDGLKRINDSFGHQEGDQALKDLTEILKKTFRESDIIGRLGGDEFVVLGMGLPEVSEGAILNRLVQTVEEVNRRPGRKYSLSLSAGFTMSDPGISSTVEELLFQADKRMYLEKRKKNK